MKSYTRIFLCIPLTMALVVHCRKGSTKGEVRQSLILTQSHLVSNQWVRETEGLWGYEIIFNRNYYFLAKHISEGPGQCASGTYEIINNQVFFHADFEGVLNSENLRICSKFDLNQSTVRPVEDFKNLRCSLTNSISSIHFREFLICSPVSIRLANRNSQVQYGDLVNFNGFEFYAMSNTKANLVSDTKFYKNPHLDSEIIEYLCNEGECTGRYLPYLPAGTEVLVHGKINTPMLIDNKPDYFTYIEAPVTHAFMLSGWILYSKITIKAP